MVEKTERAGSHLKQALIPGTMTADVSARTVFIRQHRQVVTAGEGFLLARKTYMQLVLTLTHIKCYQGRRPVPQRGDVRARH